MLCVCARWSARYHVYNFIGYKVIRASFRLFQSAKGIWAKLHFEVGFGGGERGMINMKNECRKLHFVKSNHW